MKRRYTRAKSKTSQPRAARKASVKTPKRATPAKRVILMVGTRKGAFIYYGDGSRSRWRLDGPHRLGETVNHVVLDPRDGNTMLMAARAGHLGPTIFRSTELARTWKEAAPPPAFRKAAPGENGRAVEYTFWLSPAHRSNSPDGTRTGRELRSREEVHLFLEFPFLRGNFPFALRQPREIVAQSNEQGEVWEGEARIFS